MNVTNRSRDRMDFLHNVPHMVSSTLLVTYRAWCRTRVESATNETGFCACSLHFKNAKNFR